MKRNFILYAIVVTLVTTIVCWISLFSSFKSDPLRSRGGVSGGGYYGGYSGGGHK